MMFSWDLSFLLEPQHFPVAVAWSETYCLKTEICRNWSLELLVSSDVHRQLYRTPILLFFLLPRSWPLNNMCFHHYWLFPFVITLVLLKYYCLSGEEKGKEIRGGKENPYTWFMKVKLSCSEIFCRLDVCELAFHCWMLVSRY